MIPVERLSPAQLRGLSHLQRAEKEPLSIRAYAVREGQNAPSLYGFRMWLKRGGIGSVYETR